MIKYDQSTAMEWTRLGMRKAFGKMMEDLAEDNKNIIVLNGDLAGSAGLYTFIDKYPEQFYNIGIAEQNMVGIAAGLAKEGKNVFVSSFAPFMSMRSYEAIRTVIGYMHLNVKIIAMASGLSLGVQGNTHYCLEDIALMRTIPGMLVLSPADCLEEAACLEYLSTYEGPAYLRLSGIDGSPAVYKEKPNFLVGKADCLREGEDIVILGTGSSVHECVRVTRALKKDGLSCSVFNVSTLKPLDLSTIDDLVQSAKLIVTVEEHFVNGGLGGIIAEYLSAKPEHAPLLRIGVNDEFPHAGDYNYVRAECGLMAADIRSKIQDALSI